MSHDAILSKTGKQRRKGRESLDQWSIKGNGVNLGMLKAWRKDNYQELLTQEDSKQEIALSKMKKYVIFSRKVIYIQVSKLL